MKKVLRAMVLVLFISFLSSTTLNCFAENVTGSKITRINGVVSDYSLARTGYEKNTKDIGIFFPQMNGLKDKTKQNKINKMIKAHALADFQEGTAQYGLYDLDYTIMWSSNKLLSILFTGSYYDKQAPHPNNICDAVNIDLTTGSQINLSDMINASDDFVKLFINKAQFVNDAGIDLAANPDYGLSEFKKDWFTADQLQYNFDKDANLYFTSTGIVFTINTTHAIGDFSLFSLKYSELSKFIMQTTIWKNIKTDFPAANYQIIRSQCFKSSLTGFGNTWFVSGFNNAQDGVLKALQFYLIDQNSNVKYTFPDLFSSSAGYFGVRAVAFTDVNHDGKKDIVLISQLNSTKETEVDEVGVYLCSSNRFILDSKLNSYLNTKLKDTKTVADVSKAAMEYYK